MIQRIQAKNVARWEAMEAIRIKGRCLVSAGSQSNPSNPDGFGNLPRGRIKAMTIEREQRENNQTNNIRRLSMDSAGSSSYANPSSLNPSSIPPRITDRRSSRNTGSVRSSSMDSAHSDLVFKHARRRLSEMSADDVPHDGAYIPKKNVSLLTVSDDVMEEEHAEGRSVLKNIRNAQSSPRAAMSDVDVTSAFDDEDGDPKEQSPSQNLYGTTGIRFGSLELGILEPLVPFHSPMGADSRPNSGFSGVSNRTGLSGVSNNSGNQSAHTKISQLSGFSQLSRTNIEVILRTNNMYSRNNSMVS
eukprot:gene6496-44_t